MAISTFFMKLPKKLWIVLIFVPVFLVLFHFYPELRCFRKVGTFKRQCLQTRNAAKKLKKYLNADATLERKKDISMVLELRKMPIERQATEIIRFADERQSETIVMEMLRVGEGLSDHNQLDRADTLFQRALKISEELSGTQSRLMANSVIQYKNFLHKAGRYEEAKVWEQKELAIRRQWKE